MVDIEGNVVATRVASGWRLDGSKPRVVCEWAGRRIVLCRTADCGVLGYSLFMVERETVGVSACRDSLGRVSLRLDHAVVPTESMVGAMGNGLLYCSQLVSVARWLRCMRLLVVERRRGGELGAKLVALESDGWRIGAELVPTVAVVTSYRRLSAETAVLRFRTDQLLAEIHKLAKSKL